MTQLSHEIPEQMFAERAHGVTRYRRVSLLAVASLVCGGLSFLGFMHWVFFALPLAGLACGFLAITRLRRLSRDMIGEELAWGGIAASVALGLVGWIGGTLFSSGAAPYGYTEISFEDMQPVPGKMYDPGDPGAWVPKSLMKLNGQKVFVHGFIYPTRFMTGLRNFVLVRSEQHCSFCVQNIKPTDMIDVTMAGEATADYRQGKIGVGGRLKINPEEAANPLGGMPYTIEADCIR